MPDTLVLKRYAPGDLNKAAILEVIGKYGFDNDSLEEEQSISNPIAWNITITITGGAPISPDERDRLIKKALGKGDF